jgi:hypothetical protein
LPWALGVLQPCGGRFNIEGNVAHLVLDESRGVFRALSGVFLMDEIDRAGRVSVKSLA